MGSPDTVDYHVESKVTVLELGTVPISTYCLTFVVVISVWSMLLCVELP